MTLVPKIEKDLNKVFKFCLFFEKVVVVSCVISQKKPFDLRSLEQTTQ